MKCKYCNSELKDEDKFCRNCGAAVEKEKKGKKTTKKEEVKVETTEVVTPVTPTNTESNGLAIASIVLGALSFILGWFIWLMPLVGLILGICCKKKCTEKTVGIILNSIALFFVVIVIFILFFTFALIGTVTSDLTNHDYPDYDYPYTYNDNEESLNWSTYKSLRHGTIGYNLDINGTFRILDTTTDGWVFNNGEFYWYKDLDDTDDNYWTGKYNVTTGKEGLASLGISETKIEELVRGTNVSDENIYALELKPSQIVSNGTDKSNTNIPENTKWTYVWVLVDHGSAGIEARVLNIDTSKVSYFVKLSD